MAEIIRRETLKRGSGPGRPALLRSTGRWSGFSGAGLVILALLCLTLALPKTAAATAVGRFVQVSGQVDVLKQGKEPAKAVKEQDEVEASDVVQTHAGAKAQIKFVDDSSVVISPESRMKIEEFALQADKSQRKAIFHFFRGIAEFTVSRIFNAKEPDFIVKTDTAVMGVRGTNFIIITDGPSAYLFVIHGHMVFGTSGTPLAMAQQVKTMEANQVMKGQQVSAENTNLTQANLQALVTLTANGLPMGATLPPSVGEVLEKLIKDIKGTPTPPVTDQGPPPQQQPPPSTTLGTGSTASPDQ